MVTVLLFCGNSFPPFIVIVDKVVLLLLAAAPVFPAAGTTYPFEFFRFVV